MYRADEITDPKHRELRENLEKAMAELFDYEEKKEAADPDCRVPAIEVQFITKSITVAEVLGKDQQATMLLFTSTGDVATWDAAGMAQMMLNYSNAGWDE